MMKYVLVGLMVFVINSLGFSTGLGNGKDTAKYFNWFNLDMNENKIPGLSTDKVYNEVLMNKPSTPVIVAVIDGGVDINHEDLKGKIWVNEDEIPGNGIDDDHNGFIDDIHGWNFLGGADGKSINQETMEVTRIYRKYKDKFEKSKPVNKDEINEYRLYKQAKKIYFEKLNEAKNQLEYINKFELKYTNADSIVKELLKKEDYNIDDLKSINDSADEKTKIAKSLLLRLHENGFEPEILKEYKEELETKVDYNYNIDFNPRVIVNDDPENPNDSVYGNNDVISVTPDHGTFVSGIIAADRNNDLGMKGIADNIKIIVVRAVPDGDERDKDVANAILYAVNNGAHVINMSFGKDLSPQKELVDNALRYAESKDVILVHAAGNDSKNMDKHPGYPSVFIDKNIKVNSKWISVGASSIQSDESLTGEFSNYGRKSVDIFAPGVDIYSLMPDNKYDVLNGTSFASPMVAGVAALLKSYYPNLTAQQVKDIILSSNINYKDKIVNLPADEKRKRVKKIEFGKLSATGGLLNVFNAVEMAENFSSQTGK